MYPGMMAWWKHARGEDGGFGEHAGCAPRHREHHHRHGNGHGEAESFASGFGGDESAFGVRRPLRFLAHKLELEEKQVAELARILSDLKTERAQAAVDHRRTTAGLADLVGADTFDEAKANEIAGERVKSAEALRTAVATALKRIHAVLDKEQRERLAYLLRTGALLI